MTQLTVVTQNEVSILSENPFFINDLSTPENKKKEEAAKELNNKSMKPKNRSVNIMPSLEI
jgi:F0F1-type ATP synthase epsilon subunit